MNQRVVAIVVLALFATCFVGTGAVAALTLINKAIESVNTGPGTPEPTEPAESSEPPEEVAKANPDVAPDEELQPS